MLRMKNGYSQSSDAAGAAADIARQIGGPDLKLVIFFAANQFDFAALSREMRKAFSGVELIGCTTAGEITQNGFADNSLVAAGIAADDFTPVSALIRDIHSIPMLHRQAVGAAFQKAGFQSADASSAKKGFGILLVDGLQGAEEKVLSVVNSITKMPEFQIIGGSAGDALDFKKTYICLNGEVYQDAAVITFVRTSKKFYLHKEDIFCSTGKKLTVTKSNIRERRIYEFDGQPAAQVYAACLNTTKSELSTFFMSNPLGRRIGNKIWTASPFQILPDDSIQFYSQVFPGAIVDILCPMDVAAKVKETVTTIRGKIPQVQGAIVVNCILRTLQFKNQNLCRTIADELGHLGAITGFSSYGEQFGKMHLNQTMVVLALGE